MSGSSHGDDPAGRVADLAETLASYHRRYDAHRDSRAVFAFTYRHLTRDLADRLADPDPGFDDPAWVADLALAFGARYTAAMDAIDEWRAAGGPEAGSPPEEVPRPWADVYGAICRRRSTVLEDLVFAMGAHITHDLPLALVEVGTDVDRMADYHLMNEVLAARTDAIQRTVTDRYNRFLTSLDRFAGGTDEMFTNYWIRVGRSIAWYNAMRLQSPHSREQAEGTIRRATAQMIGSVRSEAAAPVRVGADLYRAVLLLTRQWPSPVPDSTG